MAKRVLLIGLDYYPRNVPGAHRSAKLAKYLPSFGWEPVVLTCSATSQNSFGRYDPDLENKDDCTVIRVPSRYHSAKTLPGFINHYIIRAYAPHIHPLGLYCSMLRRGKQLLAEQHFDAIWATSPYIMALNVAGRLARLFNKPLVADLRDLMHETEDRPGILHRWQMHLEKRMCDRADALSIVTAPLGEQLKKRHSKPVHVIANGFDPDDFPAPGSRKSETFDIVYAGSIYAGRDPAPLFDALDLLLEQGTDISRMRACFYGVQAPQMEPYLKGRACRDVVQVMGEIPQRRLISVMQQASLLLLLSHKQPGIMPYKIFEYLAAGRTILSIPGDGDVTDALLDETGAGVAAAQPAAIAELVRQWYQQWQRGSDLPYGGKPDEIAKYTRRHQAQHTAKLLDEVCAARSNPG